MPHVEEMPFGNNCITRCGEKERFSAAETMAPIEPNGPSMSHLVILQFHTRRSLSSEHCWQSIECFGQAGLVKWPNWENCLVPALAHCNPLETVKHWLVGTCDDPKKPSYMTWLVRLVQYTWCHRSFSPRSCSRPVLHLLKEVQGHLPLSEEPEP